MEKRLLDVQNIQDVNELNARINPNSQMYSQLNNNGNGNGKGEKLPNER
jgi:hypothetical protein